MGSDADLIVFDPNAEQMISAATHHMRVDYSMFEGFRVKGVPKIVLSRGRTIIENGKFVGKPGAGEFEGKIKRENPALRSSSPRRTSANSNQGRDTPETQGIPTSPSFHLNFHNIACREAVEIALIDGNVLKTMVRLAMS